VIKMPVARLVDVECPIDRNSDAYRRALLAAARMLLHDGTRTPIDVCRLCFAQADETFVRRAIEVALMEARLISAYHAAKIDEIAEHCEALSRYTTTAKRAALRLCD
jgi:hypothetical protein